MADDADSKGTDPRTQLDRMIAEFREAQARRVARLREKVVDTKADSGTSRTGPAVSQ